MIGKTLFGVALLAVFAISGCATAHDKNGRINSGCDSVLTPSGLRTLGAACDGQHIVVRGILRVGPEMRGLWDSQEDIESANYRVACVTVHNPAGVPMDGPVRWVELSGLFHAVRPERLFILGACSDSILEIDAVRELQQELESA